MPLVTVCEKDDIHFTRCVLTHLVCDVIVSRDFNRDLLLCDAERILKIRSAFGKVMGKIMLAPFNLQWPIASFLVPSYSESQVSAMHSVLIIGTTVSLYSS